MIINKNNTDKYKIFCVIFAAVLMLAVCLNSTVFAADYDDHWARDIFQEWIDLGIIIPDQNGNINPESPVTRGDLTTYINRVMGFFVAADIHQYTDTPFGSRYFLDMSIAMGMGYISPTSANTLSPWGPVTRSEVIDIFAKVARINPSAGDETILASVRDSDQIPAERRETVAAAIVNGFIAGRTGFMIAPNEYMTVSEAVALIDRLNSNKKVYAFPGRFGPEAGMVISNYSSIMSPGVTLRNADITRDLDINWAAAGDAVNITGSNIRNKLLVNGSRVRLTYAEEGNTGVETLEINGDNVIVDINKGNRTKNIIINGKNATVNVGENVRIENLTVNSAGSDARINLASGARLDRVNLNARTDIAGSGGSIGTLQANAGSGGSHIEPRPGVSNTSSGVTITTGSEPPPRENDGGTSGGTTGGGGSGGGGSGGGGSGGGGSGGGSTATSAKRITGMSFLTELTLQINTEDVGKTVITANDFRVSVNDQPVENFTISRASGSEFNIIVPSRISPESTVTVTGENNLTGTVSASQSSQARITEAIVTGLRTISVTVTNPGNSVLAKENFVLQIANRNNDSFTVTARSSTSYDLNISADIRSGQVLKITGRNGLTGEATVSAISAIKSIVFNDIDRFTVNTDNTAGNTIDQDSFIIRAGGNQVSNFTVTEKSNTAYQITLPSALAEGTAVRVEGRKFLTGTREDIYVSPFKVSRAAVTSKTNITVTLASVPESILTTEKHAGAFKVLVDDVSVDVTGLARDPADRRGTVYILTVDLDGTQGVLTVNGVRNSNNRGLVDYVPPELVSVRMNDRALSASAPSFRTQQANARLIVEFSEPVVRRAPSTRFANRDVALSGEAFSIIAGTGGGLDLSGTRVSITGNSVVIDLDRAKRLDPGVYTLTVNPAMVFDALGNVCVTPANTAFRFEIKGTLPTVASTAQLANGDLAIRLNGNTAENFGTAMTLGGTVLISDPSRPVQESLEISHRFLSYDIRTRTINISRTALPPALNDPNNPVFLKSDVPYRMELYHPDFTRGVWQNTPADEPPLVISRATIDTERPRVERVTISGMLLYDRASGLAQTPPRVAKANATIQVEFSKPVFEQPPAKRFSAVDNFGQAFNIDTANPLDPGNNLSLSGVRVATNNRTVSIPLRSAAIMNPGSYKLEIDPALIFDAVGNSADLSDFVGLPGFPRLVCYFDIVTVPPRITAVSQNAAGDINIRFTRYYPWIANPYGLDMAGGGTVKVLDLSRPEGEEQIGRDITSEFISWTDTTQTITIRRAGLPENLTGGPYVLELNVPDYETQATTGINIISAINNDPSVTLGGSKNIPVTPNAEQTRIVPEDAIIRINFPIPVRGNAAGANFTTDNLGVTDDISALAFSVYVEDGDGVNVKLNKNDVGFSHSNNQVTINLTGAIKDMMFMKFTVAVNQSAIFDTRGTQIGTRLSVYRFKLTQTPLPILGASQIDGGENAGDIQIWFGSFENDPQSLRANIYINEICGVGGTNVSTIRIERGGEIIGEIPAKDIEDWVDALLFSKEIRIRREALERVTDSDGNRVKLDGGEYTIVLNHSAYADNRIDGVKIDTTPPVLTGFSSSAASGEITLIFTFDKDVAETDGFSVTRNGGPVSVSPPVISGRNVEVKFQLQNYQASDYTVRFTAIDKTGGRSSEIVSNPVIADPHRSWAILQHLSNIPGFKNTVTDADSTFRFGEGDDFSMHINPATRRVNSNAAGNGLPARIAAINPTYDHGLSAPAVTMKTDMLIYVPAGAVNMSYAVLKSKDMQNMPGNFIQVDPAELSNGWFVLYNEVGFYAARSNGGAITEAEMQAADPAARAAWAWTAEKLVDTSDYYIFEWVMGDGRKIYTYVHVIVGGS